MALVPVIFTGVFYPKNKKDPPMPGTFVGNAAIQGLHPDNTPPDAEQPPLEIWGPDDPRPTPPIWWEGFPDNPPDNVRPPDQFPNVGPIKPFPPEGGWGYSERTGWVFKPPAGAPGPKK